MGLDSAGVRFSVGRAGGFEGESLIVVCEIVPENSTVRMARRIDRAACALERPHLSAGGCEGLTAARLRPSDGPMGMDAYLRSAPEP